jgi:hypothetical protein
MCGVLTFLHLYAPDLSFLGVEICRLSADLSCALSYLRKQVGKKGNSPTRTQLFTISAFDFNK